MIVSAMFFGTMDDVESPFTVQLGPIRITIQELFISAVSLAIVLPPNMLVVQIFRNSKAKEEKRNTVVEEEFLDLSDSEDEEGGEGEDGKKSKARLPKEAEIELDEDGNPKLWQMLWKDAQKQHKWLKMPGEKGYVDPELHRQQMLEDAQDSSADSSEENSDSEDSGVGKRKKNKGKKISTTEPPAAAALKVATKEQKKYQADSDDESRSNDSEMSQATDDDVSLEMDMDMDDEDLWSEYESEEEESDWGSDDEGVNYDEDVDEDEEAMIWAQLQAKRCLPRACLPVGWVVAGLAIVSSGFFVILYSMDWGPEKSNAWLTAYVLSFLQGVLITDPIKVGHAWRVDGLSMG